MGMKAFEQFFHVVLFITLNKAVITFHFVDKTPEGDHWELKSLNITF